MKCEGGWCKCEDESGWVAGLGWGEVEGVKCARDGDGGRKGEIGK